MKPKPPAAPKTPAEIKAMQSLFMSPRSQEPRDESLMDWSEDIPEVQSTPSPCVFPAGRNTLSPCAPLHNRDVKGKGRTDSIDPGPSLLN